MSRHGVPPVVPWVALWSAEEPPAVEFKVTAGGIAYTDERPEDRYVDGVLWGRALNAPGSGRPQ